MSIGTAVAGQFVRVWDMFREAIGHFSAEGWRTGDVSYLTPARLAYHMIETAEFYSGATAEGFAWGGRFDVDWEAASPEQLPTQEQVLAYLDEVQSRVDAWLRKMSNVDLLADAPSFLWTGSSVLERTLYLLRHTQHHLGELNGELRRRGLPRVQWR